MGAGVGEGVGVARALLQLHDAVVAEQVAQRSVMLPPKLLELQFPYVGVQPEHP